MKLPTPSAQLQDPTAHEPTAKDYGWATEAIYRDERGKLAAHLRWPTSSSDALEDEPGHEDQDDQDDQGDSRLEPALDDQERVSVRALERALVEVEGHLGSGKALANHGIWRGLLRDLHHATDPLGAAHLWLTTQSLISQALQSEHYQNVSQRAHKGGVGKLSAADQGMYYVGQRSQGLREAMSAWEPAELCLEDAGGGQYKARFGDGTSRIIKAQEIQGAQVLEGRIKARAQALLGKTIPAPCDTPLPVGKGAEARAPALASPARPALTPVARKQPDKPGFVPPKHGSKAAQALAKHHEDLRHKAKRSGPRPLSGNARLLVVLGSASRSAHPSRAQDAYLDQTTRSSIEVAKRSGQPWGLADEALGWSEPDELLVPPDKPVSQAHKAQQLAHTAQAIYRKALQAGAFRIELLGKGRWRDELARALRARGLALTEGDPKADPSLADPKAAPSQADSNATPNPIGARCLRESWSPDPEVRMWGVRAGDGGGACPEPQAPAHDSDEQDEAVAAVRAQLELAVSAGQTAQAIYQIAPYLRVEAPSAYELRIGPLSDPLELLLFPDGRGGRAWVHFDPDADPRHPNNEHLRRVALQALLNEYGAISNPHELAQHILVQMAHEPQEPGLHLAPGADVLLPTVPQAAPPKPQAAPTKPQAPQQPAPRPTPTGSAKTTPQQAQVLDVKLSGHLAYVTVQSLTDEDKSYEVVCQRANKGWPPLYAGLRCTCPHWQTRLAQNLPPSVLPLRCKHFKFAERAARAAQEAMQAEQEAAHIQQETAQTKPQLHHKADELYRKVIDGLVASGKHDPARVKRVAQSLRASLVGKIEELLMDLHVRAQSIPT